MAVGDTYTSDYAAAAQVIVDAYAPGAPDAVKRIAVVTLAGTMMRQGPVVQVQLDGQMRTVSPRSLAMMRVSGAAEMLAPWRVIRARPIEVQP